VPVWHASIAVRTATGMLPWDRCNLKTRAIVRNVAIALLAGVGAGDMRRDRSDVVMHARKQLSHFEVSLLDSAWCAIPPVDVAGEGKTW